MLTAFFSLNRSDPSARSSTYPEIPQHFVWDRTHKEWKTRQRGWTIRHIYFVSPTAGERFYLRTLLITVKGPTSWADLRTFQGVEYPSFHATCLTRGLLENDDEWRQCLTEASLTHTGVSLRRLFSIDNISFLGRAPITPASKSGTSLSFFFLFTICSSLFLLTLHAKQTILTGKTLRKLKYEFKNILEFLCPKK